MRPRFAVSFPSARVHACCLVALALAALAGGCRAPYGTETGADSQPPPAPAAPAAKVDRYLLPEAVARCVEAFVTPYRVDGKVLQFPSAANDIDRVIVRQLMESNSDTVEAASKADDASDIDATLWSFSEVLGPAFNAERCPKIGAFLAVAFRDANRINSAVKGQFARPRPSEADPANPKLNPSFPSGHATMAGVRYRLLSAVTGATPEEEIGLCKHAWFMCFARLGVNMHYPSDVTAGFVLGEMAADELLREAREHPEGSAGVALKAAGAEWKAVRAGG